MFTLDCCVYEWKLWVCIWHVCICIHTKWCVCILSLDRLVYDMVYAYWGLRTYVDGGLHAYT